MTYSECIYVLSQFLLLRYYCSDYCSSAAEVDGAGT